jgi:hypothetical protein
MNFSLFPQATRSTILRFADDKYFYLRLAPKTEEYKVAIDEA